MPSFTIETKKIGVFLDVEECKIPDGLEPLMVYRNIISALERQGYHGANVSIKIYGEKNHEFMDEFLLASTPNIKFLPTGDASERLRTMMLDIFSLALANSESNMMVISGDNMGYLAHYLVSLKARGFHFLGATPENCRRTWDEFFTQEWLWETLSAGGDPITRAY